MSATQRWSLLPALCAALLAWGYAPVARDSRAEGDPSREIARIRHHLQGAEDLLLSRDLSTLTAPQRAARARRILELRAYRQRGIFPHNHWLSGRTPVFVDEHGTRCAMAYLIEQSGDAALVSRIARTRNLARIRELANDPALVAWLDRNGLTLDEAARVQPAYEGSRSDPGSGVSPGVWTATVMGTGAAAVGAGLNLSIAPDQKARNTRGLLGVTLGLVGVGLGTTAFTDEGAVRVLGGIDIGLGLASFGFGIRQLHATGERRPRAAGHSIAPAAWCEGGGMRRVGLVMRF